MIIYLGFTIQKLLLNSNIICIQFYREKETSAFDLSKNALIGHTKRIFKQILSRSKRDVQQFTFGTTYVQLNPNFRKFERMDPLTWKKEGISSVWTGVRGYRRVCCKNCCIDRTCQVKYYSMKKST